MSPQRYEMTMTGTLYAVGVGPGAPDLLTLRAVEALRRVDVIPVSYTHLRAHETDS